MRKFFRPFLVLLAIFAGGEAFAIREVVISEIAWMGTSASTSDEWIELRNTTSQAIDLTGWTLRSADGTPAITLAGSVQTNDFFLLERTDDTSTSVAADQIYTGALGNTGEELILEDASSTEIDRTPTGAWVAGDNGTKKTMERIDPALLGTDSGNWTTYAGTGSTATDANGDPVFGTPRETNSNDSSGDSGSSTSGSSGPPAFQSGTVVVKITEIAPINLGANTEWFEFTIEGNEAVDITDWKISNGGTPKTFGDNKADLVLGQGGQQLSGQVMADTDGRVRETSTAEKITLPADRLIFLPTASENRAWFYWQKSPVGLTDGGGTIEILDENGQVLDSITYEAAKSGTKDGIGYAEIWNRHETKPDTLYPLIVENYDTRGTPNPAPPTFPDDIELLISEVSPDRNDPQEAIDFIELFIPSSNEDPVNLKYLEVKHNGTPLLFIENDSWVDVGNFIVLKIDGNPPAIPGASNQIYKTTPGISAGSGTVEVILYSGTSWEPKNVGGTMEKMEDFLCWKNGDLSQTEQDRVDKNVPNNWNGECVDISKLIRNESIARRSEERRGGKECRSRWSP